MTTITDILDEVSRSNTYQLQDGSFLRAINANRLKKLVETLRQEHETMTVQLQTLWKNFEDLRDCCTALLESKPVES